MSKRFRFELNREGVRELMQSAEMSAVISEHTEQIRSNAEGMTGLEYETEIKTGRTRVSGTVRTGSPHAYYENHKNNTLLKALH